MIEKLFGSIIIGFLLLFFFFGLLVAMAESGLFFLMIPCFVGIGIVFIIFGVNAVLMSRVKRVERLFKATLLLPDKNGIYPVPTNPTLSSFVEPSFEVAKIYHWSNKKEVPDSLTYAPRLSVQNQATGEEIQSLADGIGFNKSFSDIQIIPNQILLGYSLDNNPKYVERKELISTLVGGQTGSGKSTLMRLILSQYLKQNCEVTIIDPHLLAGEESLGKSFVEILPVYHEIENIIFHLKGIQLEINNRLAGSEERKPKILVIDEFAGLLQNELVNDELVKTVLLISQQSRKVGVYAYCIAQQFHRDLIPSVLRNSFTTFLSTKSREDVANLLTGNKIFAKEVSKINGYQVVYMTPFGHIERLNVPNTTMDHIKTFTGVQSGSNSGSVSGSVSRETQSKDDYVVARLKLGDGINTIVREVYAVENKGVAYQDALRDIYRIIGERIK